MLAVVVMVWFQRFAIVPLTTRAHDTQVFIKRDSSTSNNPMCASLGRVQRLHNPRCALLGWMWWCAFPPNACPRCTAQRRPPVIKTQDAGKCCLLGRGRGGQEFSIIGTFSSTQTSSRPPTDQMQYANETSLPAPTTDPNHRVSSIFYLLQAKLDAPSPKSPPPLSPFPRKLQPRPNSPNRFSVWF